MSADSHEPPTRDPPPAVTCRTPGRPPRATARLNPTLVAGLVLFGLIVLCAVFAPLLTELGPDPAGPDQRAGRSRRAGHLLGTDELGPRRLRPAALRRARSTCGSACWRSVPVRHRGHPRPDRRLVRRMGRRRADARRRHGDRLPVLRAGHRAGVRARPGDDEHLHRHHPRRLGGVLPASSAARCWWPRSRSTPWRRTGQRPADVRGSCCGTCCPTSCCRRSSSR